MAGSEAERTARHGLTSRDSQAGASRGGSSHDRWIRIVYIAGGRRQALDLGVAVSRALRPWLAGLRAALSGQQPSPLAGLRVWLCDAFRSADESNHGVLRMRPQALERHLTSCFGGAGPFERIMFALNASPLEGRQAIAADPLLRAHVRHESGKLGFLQVRCSRSRCVPTPPSYTCTTTTCTCTCTWCVCMCMCMCMYPSMFTPPPTHPLPNRPTLSSSSSSSWYRWSASSTACSTGHPPWRPSSIGAPPRSSDSATAAAPASAPPTVSAPTRLNARVAPAARPSPTRRGSAL